MTYLLRIYASFNIYDAFMRQGNKMKKSADQKYSVLCSFFFLMIALLFLCRPIYIFT